MTANKQRVGFIGVGLMGHGMAKNILEKGYPLSIIGHRNRKPVEDLVKRGAREAKSPAEMARNSDVIFLCVTSSVQVEDLVRRKDGLKAGAHKGLVIVDCSSLAEHANLNDQEPVQLHRNYAGVPNRFFNSIRSIELKKSYNSLKSAKSSASVGGFRLNLSSALTSSNISAKLRFPSMYFRMNFPNLPGFTDTLTPVCA